MRANNPQAKRYVKKESILEILDIKCPYLYNYVKNRDDEMVLYHKYITHSDIITKGKRTDKKQSYARNILYYLSEVEMESVVEESEDDFPSAKQSNISLPTQFYNDINIEKLRRRTGKQYKKHTHINIAEKHDVYLVNKSLEYFKFDYTEKVLNNLDKVCDWDIEETSYKLTEGKLTKLDSLHHAIHGIGTSKDSLFHKIRMNIFRNDSLYLLIIKKFNKHEIYMFLDKNPKFFTILGIKNNNWVEYQKRNNSILLSKNKTEDLYKVEKNRSLQSKWKSLLAEEMINYSSKENEVFCPFTYISGNINHLSPLFIASHIKPFSECDAKEAYDLDNGLLLSANADALFDKYLISVDENKNIIFSFLLEHDVLLHQKLLLNQEIFKLVLNDKRMEYMRHHRKKFHYLEKKRQEA